MTNASIDFGNTRIKIGLFNNDSLLEIFRVATLSETAELLKANSVQNAIVSSVTLSNSEISENLNFLKSLIFLDYNTPLPIKNNYATPKTLGYDRIAAAVGANLRYPSQNCLIIDIGTAIKYDLVSDQNAFEGGIISPGRRMRFNALHTFTKKLPLLDNFEIPELVGHSTESCMSSGVMNGIAAEINGIIDEYLKKLNLRVLICGGDAPYFETKIKYPTFAAPNLVLEGLNRILQYNVTEI
ncbi:type III pantothenate kinase [Lacihabitans soyangensis]|uniref:Type III pantothenate kinase n=1 Tax=Lacihabitans soyangensis TaxID=869394 RepID=A0AAE3H5N7_9BACT|nr:type III pantothenate kinase [Lacihabitans soyangensis]MCP9764461.1 type III pantothenate kinase [Lacihabitans soyangensis]